MSIFALHHMIPRSLFKHKAFRGLDKTAYGADTPANLIYLPVSTFLARLMKISAHPGGHPDVYFDTAERALDRIASHADPRVRQEKLDSLFESLRIGFNRGDLYASKPDWMTDDEYGDSLQRIMVEAEDYRDDHEAGLRRVQQTARKAIETGHPHLLHWSAILGYPKRQRLAIREANRNKDTNITSENKHLKGTPFSKFAVVDDDFDVPPSMPDNHDSISSLPPLFPPLLEWLSRNEGFTRADPQGRWALPSFPPLGKDEREFDRLPPTTAQPSDPLSLAADPATGWPNPYASGSYKTDPKSGSAFGTPFWTYAPIVAGPLVIASATNPALAASLFRWLGPAGAAALADSAALAGNRGETPADDVFGSGAAPFNTFGLNYSGHQGHTRDFPPRPQPAIGASQPTSEMRGGADPYGRGLEERTPSLSPNVTEVGSGVQSGLPDARRLAEAGSPDSRNVFSAGTAAIPYLSGTQPSGWAGDWIQQSREAPGTSSWPASPFEKRADHYAVPPIFGMSDEIDLKRDANRWFANWIDPYLGPK